ncbi:MAG: NAD(P)/FAD-dependent oxidoreductase, partial [Myxococcota bacterium]
MREGLVVVGGSYAAVQTAAAARQGGYQEPIRLLTEEDRAPYQRPPLSKGLLTGAVAESALPIRADAFYREHGIEVHTRTHVRAIERDARRVMCEDGRVVAYDRLALATGARPRALSLPGAQLEGVLTLRTLADARALKEALACAENVVVIGGGFIGLEVAASAASLGRKVAVLELQDRLLARACPPGLASWFAALHAQHGVQIVLGARVAALKGDEGRVRAVALEDGSTRAADLVLAGIGVVPNAELAQACGLPCADGIVVDRLARTADARIVAAGDCTRYPSLWSEAPLRLESVQNAMDQARTAGATLAGRESPYDAVPWFWS